MQTPISFALEILLDCETIEKAHKACRKYIKQLESGQVVAAQTVVARATIIPASGPVQAPSTQRLLDAHATTTGMIPMQPSIPVTQRIVGGEVQTGNGTRGPRKF